MSEERKVGHKALRTKDGKLEVFDPHPNRTEEEKFEKWWYKNWQDCDLSQNIWYNLHRVAKEAYLQACRVRQEEIERLKEVISTQDDYVKLLTEELDELAVFASPHGWKSTRYEQGKKLRGKIIQLKEKEAK